MGTGTLYGSLKRMLNAGLVEESDNKRVDPEMDDQRRIYYRITGGGAKALAAGAHSASSRWRKSGNSIEDHCIWRVTGIGFGRRSADNSSACIRVDFTEQMGNHGANMHTISIRSVLLNGRRDCSASCAMDVYQTSLPGLSRNRFYKLPTEVP